jgi:hypothetical protein
VIRELRQMQRLHRTQPVSAPLPDRAPRSNTTIG